MPVLTAPPAPARILRPSPGWLTVIALAAVIAVNLAGLWGIRVARQGALDEARRAFERDVGSRASSLERQLSEVRSDLAFLGASPTIARLDAAASDPAAVTLLRQAAESALLLFLRSHAEVVRIGVRASDGRPLVYVGRRGGVPVLWVSASPTGREGAAIDPTRPRLFARLPWGEAARPLAGGVTIETEVEPSALLDPGDGAAEASARRCQLRDAAGVVLGRFPPGPRGPLRRAANDMRAEVPVRAEGWSAAGAAGARVSAIGRDRDRPRGAGLVALPHHVRAQSRGDGARVPARLASPCSRRGAGASSRRAPREEARVRELERQLFHAERLTTVGRLAAGIAHEINNPLEGMSNYLTLARDALTRGDAEAASTAPRRACSRASSARPASCGQVLAHADPATAPTTPRRARRACCARPANSCARAGSSAHIEVRRSSSPQQPLVGRGQPRDARPGGDEPDRQRLRGAAGGAERCASCRAGTASSRVVEVADRGPGIPEAERQRVFEPFFSTKELDRSRALDLPHDRDRSTGASSRSRRGPGVAPSSA